MENLEIFDQLVEAERELMRAEYVKFNGDTAEDRVAAVDMIKSAKRDLYALVDQLTPEQGKGYAEHRRWIFTEDALT